MQSLFLLVLLSQNGAGDINASFVNTQSLEQCEQKALMIEGIFSAVNIPVLEKRCISSKLRFSEFQHAVSTRMLRYFYLIHVEPGSIDIRVMTNWKSCILKQQTNASQGKFYCGSSIQELITDRD
jgi:hypothetical protein